MTATETRAKLKLSSLPAKARQLIRYADQLGLSIQVEYGRDDHQLPYEHWHVRFQHPNDPDSNNMLQFVRGTETISLGWIHQVGAPRPAMLTSAHNWSSYRRGQDDLVKHHFKGGVYTTVRIMLETMAIGAEQSAHLRRVNVDLKA